MTNNSNKKILIKKISYIYYPISFQEGQEQRRALFNTDSKINIMNFIFIQKLNFYIQKINIRAQKIDGFIFKSLKMVITDFFLKSRYLIQVFLRDFFNGKHLI